MRHLILIGFKHVGKSSIGQALARHLGLAYHDLDRALEQDYEQSHAQRLTAREMMQQHGEAAFRAFEVEVLRALLKKSTQSVVALGGGTVLEPRCRQLLPGHTVIHVTAPKALVYERMMLNGRPAFFNTGSSPLSEFERLWKLREPIYQSLATITVENSGSVQEAVEKLVGKFALIA